MPLPTRRLSPVRCLRAVAWSSTASIRPRTLPAVSVLAVQIGRETLLHKRRVDLADELLAERRVGVGSEACSPTAWRAYVLPPYPVGLDVRLGLGLESDCACGVDASGLDGVHIIGEQHPALVTALACSLERNVWPWAQSHLPRVARTSCQRSPLADTGRLPRKRRRGAMRRPLGSTGRTVNSSLQRARQELRDRGADRLANERTDLSAHVRGDCHDGRAVRECRRQRQLLTRRTLQVRNVRLPSSL